MESPEELVEKLGDLYLKNLEISHNHKEVKITFIHGLIKDV